MDFYKRALELKEETVSHRRFLHQNAEVGLDMPIAVEYISKKLTEYGLSPQKCGKGVTATIGHGKPVILLRADMDALPGKEDSGEAFACNKGNFHGCGHDFHAAMLLTAAKLLKETENTLCGTVKLMFQPAEEILCGCQNMVDNGILESPAPDCALAFHVAAGRMPLGMFMYNGGNVMMNSADNFRIEVFGKGGHGAYPNLAIDPINGAVHIYSALQSLGAIEADPKQICTITVGKFQGGDSLNVIPDTAVMEGSLRTDDAICRSNIKRRMEEVVENTARAFGCTAQLTWLASVPPLVCEKAFTESMVNYILELPAPKLTPVPDMKATASEDFAVIAEKIPSAMLYISAGFEDERGDYTAHNPKVQFNEDVCPLGAAAYAHCAARWLEQNSKKVP